MKNKQNNFLRNSNHQEISNGSSETKTTGALETNHTQVKQVFSSADLWNIHKKNKTSLSRRRVTSLFW